MPFTSKKSTSRAPPDQWSPARAAGPRDRRAARLAVVREARADLEQPHVAPAVTPVVRDRVHQAGQERRPERVELGRQRVRDANKTIEREAR